MTVLIGIALKSLIVGALTLALLRLLKGRSAAERSCIAHIGLLALLIIAFAPLVLPRLAVEPPRLFTRAAVTLSMRQSSLAPSAPASLEMHQTFARPGDASAVLAEKPTVDAAAAATALYALPAAILILFTFLALLRLFALRARADVLVDGHWLTALARAQRRMGFKHATALLTSNELASPIS